MSESNDSTRRAMWAATSVALVMVAQIVASRAVRDGFFLSHFEPTTLPSMMIAASIFSIAVVLGSTRLLRNIAPARTLPVFYAASGALFAIEWGLSHGYPRVAAVLLYLHTMSISAVVVSGFWSVVNERFDPHSAKQVIGRIGGGASLGGVIGGLAAWLGAGAVDIPTMILAMAGLNAGCALAVTRIGEASQGLRRRAGGQGDDEPSASVWEIFQGSSYLRNIAALVILSAFAQAAYDYVFKTEAVRRFESGAELVSFFALFYLGISVITFAVQNLAAKRTLERFGLAFTVASLPGVGFLMGAVGLVFPGLAAGIGMRGGTGVVENSLFRSGYELLYTPVLPEKKRPTKTLIDVGGDKLGTAIGGGVAFFIIGIFPGIAAPLLVFAGVAASLWGLVIVRRLHHGYVESLADRLRAGNLDVEEVEVVDATLRLSLSEAVTAIREETGRSSAAASGAAGAPGRTEFVARMDPASLRSESRPRRSGPMPRPFVAPPLRTVEPSEIDAILVAIADLRSMDPQRVGDTLAQHSPLPRVLVGHVVPLLADDEFADAAAAALRKVAPANTGALLDAALQSRTPQAARRRLCELLARLPTQRAVDGLVSLLADPDFELRFRGAASLLEIKRISPQLDVPRDRLFEVALAEALDSRRRWRAAKAISHEIRSVPAGDSPQGRRVLQGVTLIFTLLRSVLEREPLQLAIASLSGAGSDRGTGLEYLENVLPGSLQSALRPLLIDPELALDRALAHSDVLTELESDVAAKPKDLAALRRQIDSRRSR
jgi:AAA family ATP:ADP antiporter